MAKFVCCGLNFEATILKKETKFTTKALNLSYQKKILFYGLCSGDVLIDRDIRWIVTADMRLLNLTINRNLRLNLTISGAKFKKIK